jgi:hypothetical protein
MSATRPASLVVLNFTVLWDLTECSVVDRCQETCSYLSRESKLLLQ